MSSEPSRRLTAIAESSHESTVSEIPVPLALVRLVRLLARSRREYFSNSISTRDILAADLVAKILESIRQHLAIESVHPDRACPQQRRGTGTLPLTTRASIDNMLMLQPGKPRIVCRHPNSKYLRANSRIPVLASPRTDVADVAPKAEARIARDTSPCQAIDPLGGAQSRL